MLSIDLVTVPYDSGRRGHRMGAGPQALLRDGLVQRLRTAGHDVELIPVESTGPMKDDVSTAFDLASKVARVTRSSRSAGRFPLTLSGNCFGTVGAFASVAGDTAGALWFDAHGDLNTPATSTSGFLDGMAAAVLLGWCHADRARDILPPLAESRLMLAGIRDLDPPEAEALGRSAVKSLSPADVRDATVSGDALAAFTTGMRTLYLHVDADVLDSDRVGRANDYACAGGLTAQEVIDLATAAGRRARIAGMTVSSYDPAVDADAAVRNALLSIITASVAAAVAGPDA